VSKLQNTLRNGRMKNVNLHYQNTEHLSKSIIGRCSKVPSRRPNRYSSMKKFKKPCLRIKDLGIP